jgi:hypothetical protein
VNSVVRLESAANLDLVVDCVFVILIGVRECGKDVGVDN